MASATARPSSAEEVITVQAPPASILPSLAFIFS